MKLRRLVVSQFRCWSYREFDLPSDTVYFAGPNGSGKTSLLEAVGYLSRGRSFRRARDHECVQWGRGGFSLRGDTEVPDADSPGSLSVAYRSGGEGPRKVARLNDELLPRLSLLRRHFPTVVFSPRELRVLQDGPARRREFLNDLLSQRHEDYLEHYRAYEKARRQRNSLLKRPDPDELLMDQYERTMARDGRRIMERRRAVISPLEEGLREHLSPVNSDLSESLSLRYDPDVTSPEDYRGVLREERSRARERGHTTVGPHRDDWMIHLDGRQADRFASRGEVRILLLGLKITQASLIMKALNTSPILLLDDLESELDREHRERFQDRLREVPSQVLITGTRRSGPDGSLEADRIIRLETGS